MLDTLREDEAKYVFCGQYNKNAKLIHNDLKVVVRLATEATSNRTGSTGI